MRGSEVLLRRSTSPRVALLLAGLSGGALLGVSDCPQYPQAAAVRVFLDPEQTHQTIEAIGGAASTEEHLRAMPEPARSEVMDLVFGDLEPAMVRYEVPHPIEPTNDDADPSHVNAAGFVFPEDHFWQQEQILARGAPLRIAALWSPPAWMKTTGQTCCGGSLLPGMEAELAEFFSVYLDFHRDAGHPLDALSIQNEPVAVQFWDTNTYTNASYAFALETVAQRLVADGHTTPLIAPDNATPFLVPVFLPLVLGLPTARPLLRALAFHPYGAVDYYHAVDLESWSAQMVARAAPVGLPTWMTEFSNISERQEFGSYAEAMAQAELLHHALVGGVSGYLIWNLYYPWSVGEALVWIDPAAGEYIVTPKYWTARQYMKYVRPGAVRIGATSADPDLLVTAYRGPSAGATTAVLINRGADARYAIVEAEVSGVPTVVRTSPTEQGREIPPDSVERFGHRTFHLPAQSVTTIIWPGS